MSSSRREFLINSLGISLSASSIVRSTILRQELVEQIESPDPPPRPTEEAGDLPADDGPAMAEIPDMPVAQQHRWALGLAYLHFLDRIRSWMPEEPEERLMPGEVVCYITPEMAEHFSFFAKEADTIRPIHVIERAIIDGEETFRFGWKALDTEFYLKLNGEATFRFGWNELQNGFCLKQAQYDSAYITFIHLPTRHQCRYPLSKMLKIAQVEPLAEGESKIDWRLDMIGLSNGYFPGYWGPESEDERKLAATLIHRNLLRITPLVERVRHFKFLRSQLKTTAGGRDLFAQVLSFSSADV